jgi:hypothetical protein
VVRRAVETGMRKGKKYGRKRGGGMVRKGIRKGRKRDSYTLNAVNWNLLRNYFRQLHRRRLPFDNDVDYLNTFR